MGRRNKRQNYKRKEYDNGLPDIVEENTRKAELMKKKESKIKPPPLAIPDPDAYGQTMPELHEPYSLTGERQPEQEGNFQPSAQPAPTGKKAIAFVDYEHWFYSMWTEFGVRPNIEEWMGFISGDHVMDIRFYADFSKEEIYKDLPRVRSFNPTVLDTRSPNAKSEKDFTDFILLNDLYRLVLVRSDIEKVILVSGDGHFSPAVSFLRNSCGLEVEVYGVRGCINTSQRLAASILHELPGTLDYLLPCSKDILSYINKVHAKASWYNFCFMPLAEQVAACYGYSLQIVKDALETLIRQGYMFRDVRYVNGKEKGILDVHWDAVARGGLTPPDVRYASTELSRAQTEAESAVALMEDDIEEEDDETAVHVDSFIQARMDEIDTKSSANATGFMQYYRENNVVKPSA